MKQVSGTISMLIFWFSFGAAGCLIVAALAELIRRPRELALMSREFRDTPVPALAIGFWFGNTALFLVSACNVELAMTPVLPGLDPASFFTLGRASGFLAFTGLLAGAAYFGREQRLAWKREDETPQNKPH